MNNLYSCYKQILGPSVVDHCVEAQFTAPNVINLIVVKGNVLSIYIVREVDSTPISPHEPSSMVARLFHVKDYTLQGPIISIGVVRTNASVGQKGMDSLLLAFKDAKLSLVEFSRLNHELVTVSIHYYEREEFRKDFVAQCMDPKVIVDPQFRSAILNFYNNQLAIIPFRQEANMDLSGGENTEIDTALPYFPSYVVAAKEIDYNIKHIVDIQFLYDYFEPTVAILYETVQTWAGRLATKQDTKSVAVVSIDTVNRNFTVLYTVSRLPYNAYKLISVPSPVGGFLVLSPNGLIHVDQNSIPGVSLGVNKYFGAEAELAIHSPGPNPLYHAPNLTDETNRGLTLESSQAFFLNPDLLLFVLSNGDAMTVQLMGSDDFGAGWKRKNHGVKRFQLEMLPIKVPSLLSACRLGLGAIPTNKNVARVLGGLGSAHSQEVAYGYAFLASKHSDGILLKFEERYEALDLSEQPNKKSKIDEEIDDFDEIYGMNMSTNDQDATKKNRVLSLRISDSLTNIGTIKDMAVGQPVNGSQFYYTPSVPHPELDIVTLSGKDSFGSLNVLQRNLRPLILQSFDMPNVDNVWAISVQKDGSRKQYLFVNSNRRTEVYDATTTDIVEVADQFFSRDRGTVHVVAISDAHVLQITVRNVFLFDQDGTLVQDMEMEDPIVDAIHSGPYVLLRSNKHRLHCLSFNESSLINHRILFESISTFCVAPNIWNNDTASYALMTTDVDAVLRVYSLDEDAPILLFTSFGLSSLADRLHTNDEPGPPELRRPKIREIACFSIHDTLVIVARLHNSKLVTYRSIISVDDEDTNSHLSFIKIPNDASVLGMEDKSIYRLLRPFSNLGVHHSVGLAVLGKRPLFISTSLSGPEALNLIVSVETSELCRVMPPLRANGKEQVRFHQSMLDGAILAFTEYLLDNGEKGMLYYNDHGMIRVATLPPNMSFDHDWPYRKFLLGYNAEKIIYHPRSETYVVAASEPDDYYKEKAQYSAAAAAGVLDLQTEDGKPPIVEPREPSHFAPKVKKFCLHLVSPVTWETVDKIPLGEYEHVLCMEVVQLDSKQTVTGKKSVVSIGTAFGRGEDLMTRGRTLLLDIIDVVPEPDNPQTNHKFKKILFQDEKGPVSAICGLYGYLVTAIGSKVIVSHFEEDETLTGVAFFDVSIYITSIQAVKNLIMATDILKGTSFLVFQEEPPKITLLGKDHYKMSILAGDFILDRGNACMVVSDLDKNVTFLQYSPYNILSVGGQKLLRKSDLYLGSSIEKFVKIRKLSDPLQNFLIGGDEHGGIRLFTPVSEDMFKRLYGLYSKMVTTLRHYAGLNPRGFRRAQSRIRNQSLAHNTEMGPLRPLGPRLILDGDLIYQYASLSLEAQFQLAKLIGSTPQRILDDLHEVYKTFDYV